MAWLLSRTRTASLPTPPPPTITVCPSRQSWDPARHSTLFLFFYIYFLSLLHSPIIWVTLSPPPFSLFTHVFGSCCFFFAFSIFFFLASFNKALVRNPHTDALLHFPYKRTHKPTQHVNFSPPTPPRFLCGVHVCHLVTVCGLNIKPAA